MKTLLFLTFAGLGLAQNSIFIRVTKGGVESVAKVSGPAAAAGIEVLEKWMATQTVCFVKPFTPGTPAVIVDAVETVPAVAGIPSSQTCTQKYAHVADWAKEVILATTETLAPLYPSAALKADVDDVAARQAALEAKRKALFDAARAEKP